MSRPRIADQIPLLRIRADGMEERTMSVVDAPDGARDDRALAVLDELAIPGSNPRTDDVERLVEDAATGRLVPSHPNLSATWAAEHDGDHLRVLWHLQPGPPLAPLLESIRSTGEPPSLSRALGLLARLADALEHLHADLDRIHGALAPSTVRLTTGGEPTLDGLGGARLALAYGQTEGRISGRRLAYLSPEHCLDESLDPRSDVFTWGILAWELVTGGTLYGGQDDFERMRAICDESPPAPSSRNDEIPPLLNSLIQKALASDPEDRFDHAGGLREALEQTVLSSTDIANPEDTAAWAADALPQRWSGWANVADHLAAGEDRAAIESVAELYPDAERLEHPTADPDDEEEKATDEPPSSDFDVAVPAPVDEDESETSPPALPDDSDEPTAPDRGAGDVPEEPASESDGSIADDAHRPPPDDPGEALAAMTVEEWLENDEEEPEHHRPPFSTEELLDDQPRHRHEEAERDSGSVLEVVRLVDDRVLDVDVLHRFHRRYAPAGIPFSARLKRRGAVLTAEGELEGVVRRSDGGVDPPPSPGDAVDLQPGDVAELVDGDLRFRIRHLRAIRAPSGEETSGPSIGFYALAAAIALAVHGLATMGIVTLHSQFGVAMSVGDQPRDEVFAEGRLKKPEKAREKSKPDKPPPTPEKKPPSKPKLPDELQKKLQKQVEEKKQAAKHDSKAEQLEAALQAPSEGKVDSVGDAVSNIDAANSPTEESTKKVGGVLKGIEGDGVNVAGGGAENLGDIGSGVGESTGKLAQRKKDENVRAQVDSVESLADVEGKLSRGKIVSVIDGRQGDIQGCYEKELLSNPGLGGKITFEWTIQPDGTVTNARQIHSSMGHAPVSNCILKILRSLTFPKPKGGSVTIQFPFMFRSG